MEGVGVRIFPKRLYLICEQPLNQSWVHFMNCFVPYDFYTNKSFLKVYKIDPPGLFHQLIHALRQTICTLCPTFEKLLIGAKFQRKAQKIGFGCNKVSEINPMVLFLQMVSFVA